MIESHGDWEKTQKRMHSVGAARPAGATGSRQLTFFSYVFA